VGTALAEMTLPQISPLAGEPCARHARFALADAALVRPRNRERDVRRVAVRNRARILAVSPRSHGVLRRLCPGDRRRQAGGSSFGRSIPGRLKCLDIGRDIAPLRRVQSSPLAISHAEPPALSYRAIAARFEALRRRPEPPRNGSLPTNPTRRRAQPQIDLDARPWSPCHEIGNAGFSPGRNGQASENCVVRA